jgi:hypothetical protein
MKKLWNFLNSRVFLYLVSILIVIFLAGQCKRISDLKKETYINDQNIGALKDSIRIAETKNGKLQAEKTAFFGKESDLKKINESLYKDLKNQKGKVVTLNRTVLTLNQNIEELNKYIDSLESAPQDPIFNDLDSTWTVPWTLSYTYDTNNFDIFKGFTKIDIIGENNIRHISTRMTNRQSSISLTFGQKVEDGKLRVFVQSGYPGLTPSSLEGVLIDPNSNKYLRQLSTKRHWFTGFGVGPNLDIGYDLINQRPSIFIGVGVHYSIYSW